MIEFPELDPSVSFSSQLEQHTGPVELVNLLVAPPGQVDALLAIWEEDAKLMKAAPGFISTQLHRGTGGSSVLCNIAVWESTQALAAALSTPAFKSLFARYPDGIVVNRLVVERIAVPGICIA